MKLWQMGFGGMPKGYIVFHRDCARLELSRLKDEFGLCVHGDTTLVSDGWMDGMRVLQAIVETPSGSLLKLRWHDSNQGFFKKFQSGGSGALSKEDLA
jgi:hypothetical protein